MTERWRLKCKHYLFLWCGQFSSCVDGCFHPNISPHWLCNITMLWMGVSNDEWWLAHRLSVCKNRNLSLVVHLKAFCLKVEFKIDCSLPAFTHRKQFPAATAYRMRLTNYSWKLIRNHFLLSLTLFYGTLNRESLFIFAKHCVKNNRCALVIFKRRSNGRKTNVKCWWSKAIAKCKFFLNWV